MRHEEEYVKHFKTAILRHLICDPQKVIWKWENTETFTDYRDTHSTHMLNFCGFFRCDF